MDFDRITKLLELAGHPTTSDPEALNAVRAARKAISGGNGTFAELIRARPTISGMEAVLRTELEEEKRELAVVRAEAATLRADLGAARSEIPRLQKLLHESQKKAAHAKRRLRNVKAHLEETQQDLSKACVRVDLQERREKRVTDELAQKLKDKTQESDELYDRFVARVRHLEEQRIALKERIMALKSKNRVLRSEGTSQKETGGVSPSCRRRRRARHW